jgi:parallel beta-helix repeat protein
MRKILLLFLLSSFIMTTKAQLFTPGTGVHWNFDSLLAYNAFTPDPSGNFYVLNDNVFISPSDTVTLTNDDTLKVSPAKLVTVEGTLIIDPVQQLVITSTNPSQKFMGFRFDNSPGSVIRNAHILNAGGIKLVYSNVLFEYTTFSQFDKSHSTGTIDAFYSDPVIRYCSFTENAGPAVASGSNGYSSPQIYYSQIIHNNTSNANTPQINLGTSGADTVRIVGNTIDGLYDMGGGIALSTLIGGSAKAIIDSNTITNNRYGIAAIGSNIRTIIRHNYIADNNIQGNPMQGGSGLNFQGGTTNTAQISHNEITGNLWGVTIQSSAQPNLGHIEPDTLNIGWNKIYGNGNSGVIYNLYNNTSGNIKAENNYWGSYIPDTVETTIFHQPDDPSLGFVDYLPLSPIITDAPARFASANERFVELIYPNPARDVVRIRLNEAMLPEHFTASIAVVNMLGQQVFRMVQDYQGKDMLVPLSTLPAGLYYLSVDVKGARAMQPLMIQP